MKGSQLEQAETEFELEFDPVINEVERVRPKPFDLKDFLQQPNFFPVEFGWERIEETPDALFVVGRELVFKFLSSEFDPNQTETFRDRWSASVYELETHQELAPDLYLGVQAFRWVTGVPVWTSDDPIALPKAKNTPRVGDGVAIVMRRLFSARTLPEMLRGGDEEFRRYTHRIAKRIAHFHESEIAGKTVPVKRLRAGEESDSYPVFDFKPTRFRAQYFPADSYSNVTQGVSDRFILNAVFEGRNTLESHYREVESKITYRAKAGVHSIGSSITPHHILFGHFRSQREQAFIFPRVVPQNAIPTTPHDPLAVLADLVFQLEVGGSDEGEKFLSSYQNSTTLFDAEIYRFFHMSASLRFAEAELVRCRDGSGNQNRVRKALEIMLGDVIQRPANLIIALSVDRQLRRRYLGSAIAAVLNGSVIPGRAEFLSREMDLGHYPQAILNDIFAERMSAATDRELHFHKTVILEDFPTEGAERLKRIGKLHGAEVIIIPCESVVDGEGNARSTKSRVPKTKTYGELTPIELSNEPADSFFTLLHEIRARLAE